MTTYKHRENFDVSDERNDESDNILDDLADRINALNDRLTTSNIENMISESRQKLDKWRTDGYNLIDRYYEQKCREFERHVTNIVDKQRKEINRIRSSTATLIHKHDISSKDIDYVTAMTRQLQQDIDDSKDKYLRINIHSLEINENLIEIKTQNNHVSNSLVIAPPYRTINYIDDNSKVLCANERYILVHHDSSLCLLDKSLSIVRERNWTQGYIMDMCWSTALARFIVLTRSYAYLVDESTMAIVRLQKMPKLSWWSCTCSDTCLYVTTKDWGSNIYQFTMWPSVQLERRWQPPQTCKQNETINNIIYSKEKLALLIYNRLTKSKIIELRVSNTLDCLWSLNLDIDYDSRAIRCSLLNNEEWLVIDWNTSNLYQITNDGKIKSTSDYHPTPFCATLFGTNILAISTIDGINLHKF